jgi:cytochrome c5
VRRSRGLAVALLLLLFAGLPDGSEGASRKSKRRPKGRSAKSARPAPANFDVKLPVLGTRLAEFPPGEGKAVADQACLNCHSADVVRQQRLTEKQWAASLAKMSGWGAEVPESRKASLLAYLVRNFGPDNDRFQPVVTRPVGR